jgi:hypothetical protein
LPNPKRGELSPLASVSNAALQAAGVTALVPRRLAFHSAAPFDIPQRGAWLGIAPRFYDSDGLDGSFGFRFVMLMGLVSLENNHHFLVVLASEREAIRTRR